MKPAAFLPVEEELAHWPIAGPSPLLWLRDDDATHPTAALDRLLDMTGEAGCPLLLAVVPKPAIPALAERLADAPHVTPAVHGFAHANHAPPGAKSTELIETPDRDCKAVLADLLHGRRKLERLFGAALSTILVPPWNRISPAVAKRIGETGFSAISVFGWAETTAPLPHLNTHVDLMNWRGGRVGHDAATVCAMLAARLGEARLRGGAPIGLLTHHLAHDATAWATLETVLDFLKSDGRIRVCEAGTALQATSQL